MVIAHPDPQLVPWSSVCSAILDSDAQQGDTRPQLLAEPIFLHVRPAVAAAWKSSSASAVESGSMIRKVRVTPGKRTPKEARLVSVLGILELSAGRFVGSHLFTSQSSGVGDKSDTLPGPRDFDLQPLPCAVLEPCAESAFRLPIGSSACSVLPQPRRKGGDPDVLEGCSPT